MIAVACGSSESKPSKEAITDHLVELVLDQGDLGGFVPKETLTKIYGCLIDEIYDDVSDETLKNMLEIKKINEKSEYPVELSSKEKKVFDDASDTCDKKFGDELGLELQPTEN